MSRLHGLGGVLALADDIHARGLASVRPRLRGWLHPKHFHPRAFRLRPRRTPSVALILLAGLAVFAFVKLMSLAGRPRRSTAQRVAIGVLLLAVGAVVMSFRRSARRYSW